MLTTEVNRQSINQVVWRAFTKGHGLSLKADAASYLIDKIASNQIPESEIQNAVDYIAQSYSKISKGNVFTILEYFI